MFENKGIKAISKQRKIPYQSEEWIAFERFSGRLREMIIQQNNGLMRNFNGIYGVEMARINLDFRDLYPEIQRVNYTPSVNQRALRLTRPDENNNGIIIDHVNLFR